MELKVTMLCLFVNSETGCVSNWMYPSQVCIHFLSPWTEPEVLVTLKRVPAATECLQARAGSISNFLHIIDLRGKREKKTKTQILFDTAQNRPRQWNSFCILYKYRDTYLINEILLSETIYRTRLPVDWDKPWLGGVTHRSPSTRFWSQLSQPRGGCQCVHGHELSEGQDDDLDDPLLASTSTFIFLTSAQRLTTMYLLQRHPGEKKLTSQ